MSILTLCLIGCIAAVILFLAAKKFHVEEDPRIAQVEALLPSANCGGCGFPGCHGFAEALVKAPEIGTMACPASGPEGMKAIAALLGQAVSQAAPKIAVVRCGGTCEKRPRTSEYDGVARCASAAALYIGESDCPFGCLGCGDCVAACRFDAIAMDPATGLPVVDEEKCVACGACAKACPRTLIEMRPKGPKGRRMYVACRNTDKGALAKKACAAACIGCGKCAKVCGFEAIAVENNLAYIDPAKCKLCRKCAAECPTGAIAEANFPPRKPVQEGATEQTNQQQ